MQTSCAISAQPPDYFNCSNILPSTNNNTNLYVEWTNIPTQAPMMYMENDNNGHHPTSIQPSPFVLSPVSPPSPPLSNGETIPTPPSSSTLPSSSGSSPLMSFDVSFQGPMFVTVPLLFTMIAMVFGGQACRIWMCVGPSRQDFGDIAVSKL